MNSRSRTLTLWGALLLMCFSFQAHAQTVSCTGVAEWNPATIYNPGNRLVYKNSLYEAAVQIWNTAPDYCPSCNWYRLLGSCSGGGGGNNAPTAQITAPAQGASFTSPANITISATASDSDGTITKVDFFRGSTLIATDTTAPYSVSWTNVGEGAYSLTALATDNTGATGRSAVVNIVVNPPSGGGQCSAPLYSAGTAYTVGQLVRNEGNVYRCEIAGWCSSSAAWAYAPGTGMHWQDAWTLMGPCSGGGTPPVVSLTSPSSGASFSCGATVSLAASASDADGFVSKVEFFDGGALIGADTTAPYSVSWLANSSGSHQLTAKATDERNNSTNSSAVSVSVGTCSGGGTGLPARVLVGYWHNFDNGSGFIKLRDVSTDWDVINIAFGEPVAGSTSRIGFTPTTQTSAAEIQSDVQILHSRGKKVLLSVGGANGHVELRNATERQEFIDSVTAIIRQYGLDGLDVDFEGQSVHLNPGDSDFSNPTTPVIVNLISALRQIRSNIGSNFVLTMAPETFFVQVGYQFYGGTSGGDSRTGAYLPVIHGVRDILTLLHVQDYNSGSVVALDNQVYAMGNADFHVAMTEMLMTGFPVANTGRTFPGLRPDQVAIGLPANVNAGNGWTPVPQVQQALNYLILGQSFGGRYVLRNPSGYRSFRGLMSWSINWDRFAGFDFSRNHRAYLNALPRP
jgi:chitinase/chitodextrinase